MISGPRKVPSSTTNSPGKGVGGGFRSFFSSRPLFDGFFFNEIGMPFFNREARKAQRGQRQRAQRNQRPRAPPQYPPNDPFGTTEYIPLPGRSHPSFALPVTHENPHFKPNRATRFRRPIRQVDYENFLYDSSFNFNKNHDLVVYQTCLKNGFDKTSNKKPASSDFMISIFKVFT